MTSETTNNISFGDESSGDDPQPSGASFVKITTTPYGVTFTASVPEGETGRMLETVTLVSSISGIVIGLFAMAKSLEMIDSGMPWPIRVACLAMAAVLPLACSWLARRR
ncbi:hypothetical protein ACFO3J_03880 [Streptomyces polygonati]|uniref:Uncharacterized protein n=1 Tax=Streptomyces polygonati TaxID=1617087 RepID=A0ABV8HEQ1_9ACTN